MQFDDITTELQRRLSPKRFRHSDGVCRTALALASRYSCDREKVRLAAILHDCAREIPNNTLLQMAEAFGIVVSDVEKCQPVLLHAPVGAEVARRDFGIEDEEIFRAIALHTTGGINMTVLDQIIYLADFIEPGRKFPGVDQLRELAREDLQRALLAAYDQSLCYIVQERGLLHPDTIAGRNE